VEAVNVAEFKEIVELIKEKGGDPFKLCYQCGKCDTLCPWNGVTTFSIRRIIRQATFGLTEIENEDIWRCTTCGRCPQQCPRGVNQIEAGIVLRKIATEYGVFPTPVQGIRTVRGSLVAEGNPLKEKREERADWAKGLSVNTFTEGMEILYFPGCYPCYDPRMQKVAKATANILSTAGVDYGILGTKENCCGESIRKTGDEELFRRLARENIKTFIDNGVKKILVSSPHCYHTFKVLKKIPGLELIEMPEAREDGLCCGGGGGRIWMETPKGERFSDLRLEQAIGVGAEVLVTCCPYCITNFEDSRKTLEDQGHSGGVLEVKDITEIIQELI